MMDFIFRIFEDRELGKKIEKSVFSIYRVKWGYRQKLWKCKRQPNYFWFIQTPVGKWSRSSWQLFWFCQSNRKLCTTKSVVISLYRTSRSFISIWIRKAQLTFANLYKLIYVFRLLNHPQTSCVRKLPYSVEKFHNNEMDN